MKAQLTWTEYGIVAAGPAAKFSISATASTAAVGSATTVTVRVLDSSDLLVTSFQDDVTLAVTGSATGAGLVDITNGVGSLTISNLVSETVTLSLVDSMGTGLDVSSSDTLAFFVPATLTIAGGIHNFGSLLVGSAPGEAILTVNHSGGVPATGLAGSALAAPFAFKGGNYPGTDGTCGTEINVACTIVVTFTPSGSGTADDTVNLTYHDGVTTQTVSKGLTGLSQQPATLTFAGGSPYNFGSLVAGSSTNATITINHSGDVPAVIGAETGMAAPYSFAGGGYPGTMGTCPPSITGTCTIVINYAPVGAGTFNDAIELGYNNGLSAQTATYSLTGTATAPALLTISDWPMHNFGPKAVGSSTEKIFTITHSGGAPATLMNGPALPAPFSYKGGGPFPGTTGSTCTAGGTLSSGNCTFVVTFAPSAPGTPIETITLDYNNGAVLTNTSVGVTGTGAAPATLTISDGPIYDFQTKVIGSVTEHSFTITNSGGVPATGLVAGTALSAPFSFKGGLFPGTGGNCDEPVPVGGSCNVVVVYSPVAPPGFSSDTLNIAYNNGVTDTNITRPIQGTGASLALLTISNGPIYNFQTKAVGSSSEMTFTITNAGGLPATAIMSGAVLTGPFKFKSSGIFPGSGGTCVASGSLDPTDSCTIVVTYEPVGTGTLTSTINISYNNSASVVSATGDVTGTGVTAAALSISETGTYNYGTQATGSSTDWTFTITNTGGATATAISEIGLAAPFQFQGGGGFPGTTGTCAPFLAGSGANCTIVVTYSPALVGLHSDSIDIQYHDGVAFQGTSRPVQGEGASLGFLSISGTDPFPFGTKVIGTSTDMTFTVSNTGGLTASNINSVPLTAPFSYKGGGPFPGSGGTCVASGSLDPTDSCTIVVTYTPGTAAPHSDTINISYNNSASVVGATRNITGTGATAAVLTIAEANPHNFGNKTVGSSTDMTFNITNSGGTNATAVGDATLSGHFTYKGDTFPGTGGTCTGGIINGGASCTVIVTYTPGTAAPHVGTMNIAYNNGVSGQNLTHTLNGNGLAPAVLTIAEANPHNFGNKTVGSSTDMTFNITNSGGTNATAVGDATLSGHFTYKGDTFPGTGGTCTGGIINGGASCTVIVTYTPGTAAPHVGTMNIAYNNGVSGQSLTHQLDGNGLAPAVLTFTPLATPYNYGTLAIGSNNNKSFIITHSGDVPATDIDGIGLAAPFSFEGGDFPGTSGNCEDTLASGNCTIVVTYTPVLGPTSDTIEITYNNGASVVSATRVVEGTGAAPAVLTISESDPYDFGTIPVNTVGTHIFTVTNTGGVSATGITGTSLTPPFSFEGGFPGPPGGNCGATLTAGASCSVAVTFAPTTVTTFTGVSFDINYNNGLTGDTATRGVQGTASGQAVLAFNPASPFDLGTLVMQGPPVTHIFTVENTGGVIATGITPSALLGSYSYAGGSFPGTGGNCPTTTPFNLTTGQSCDIAVRLTPPATPGAQPRTVTLTYDDGVSAGVTSTYEMNAMVVPPATLSIDLASHDYGFTVTGTPTPHTFTVTNNSGTVPATGIYITGLAAPFSRTGGSCDISFGSLGPSQDCTIEVTFNPPTTQPYSAYLNVFFHNGVIPSAVVSTSLTGHGSTAQALLVYSEVPTNSMGVGVIGDIGYRQFKIKNVGMTEATAMGSAPTQVTGTGFAFAGGSYPGTGTATPCGVSLASGADCTVRIQHTYYPGVVDAATGQIKISYHNGVATTSSDLPIYGRGIDPSSVSRIAIGRGHTCYIDQLKKLWCWGDNTAGQLGRGDYTHVSTGNYPDLDETTPVDLGNPGAPDYAIPVSVSAGAEHTCVLLTTGKVKCWGNNDFGQLGLERPDWMHLPEPVDTGPGTVIGLVSGANHNCVIVDGDKIRCWGLNDKGQLGYGDTNLVGREPGTMGANLGNVDFAYIYALDLAAGAEHTCARVSDGSTVALKCWGNNEKNQLGLVHVDGSYLAIGDEPGEMGDTHPPVDLGPASPLRIAAGEAHTCAILDNGQTKCWGFNGSEGRLGTEDTYDHGSNWGDMGSNLPAINLDLGIPMRIVTGSAHTCVANYSGVGNYSDQMKCWGYNASGQLGLNDDYHRGSDLSHMGSSLPVIELDWSLLYQIEIAAGYEQTCALLTDGSSTGLKCWGNNDYGQLGQDSTMHWGNHSGVAILNMPLLFPY